jgi:hypothetical protein
VLSHLRPLAGSSSFAFCSLSLASLRIGLTAALPSLRSAIAGSSLENYIRMILCYAICVRLQTAQGLHIELK